MAVRDISEEENEAFLPALPIKKGMAVVFWLLAVMCTYQATAIYLSGAGGWVAAFLLQTGCTFAESPIWRRWVWVQDVNNPKQLVSEKRAIYGRNVAALLFDAASNVAGTAVIVDQLHRVPFVDRLFIMTTGLPASPITGIPALVISVVLGLLLSGLPELLWYDED